MRSDSQKDDNVPAPDDFNWERTLGDALEAPTVPRSLIKRVERGIAEEWNGPADDADRPSVKARQTAAHWVRWPRALPLTAAAAALAICFVLIAPGSRSYAWSAVLKAMAQSGVVQIESADGVRWLSLSEGVVGERAGESAKWFDSRQRIVLARRPGDAQINRYRLPQNAAADRDQLALGFLLGEAVTTHGSPRWDGLRVVKENWRTAKSDGRDVVWLDVTFETDAREELQLRLKLDPESKLPLALETGEQDARQQTGLSYPQADVQALRAQEFPIDLAVVDAGEVPQDPVDGSTAVAAAPELGEADALPMVGAPAKWQPVVITKHSRSEMVRRIDGLVAEMWRKQSVEPAAAASDEELMRRVYLDLIGRTPSVHEARSYLDSKARDRYERLVNRLLASPDHASHMAAVWRTFLIPEGVDLADFGGIEAFDRWLAKRFASEDPYDTVVRELLLAEGRLSRSGPLLFYSAAKLDAHQLAARTSRVFLGMRLECAQCHDHPFEPWSQQDFWGFAAFFAQISRPQAELEAVSTVMRVRDVDRGEVMLPDSADVVAPKFLDGADPAGGAARRKQLARWLTGAANPYFARATANRVWGQLFGKGIVDPVDDFGTEHPPKSAALLDALAGHFVGADFDLRELFRVVAMSRAYRLSSRADSDSDSRLEWFAQMHVKTLSAEQIYDCITVATMLDAPQAVAGQPNVVRFGNGNREQFLREFRTPTGRPTEYHGGIPQALTLMNGALIEGATGLASSGLLKSLEAPFFSHRQRLEVMFLATLSRYPRPAEWEILNKFVPPEARGQELREGLADVLWVLLNGAEFTMNH